MDLRESEFFKRWIDDPILSDPKLHFDDPILSDLKLQLHGKTVHVHRIVLCQKSGHFNSMLTGRSEVCFLCLQTNVRTSDSRLGSRCGGNRALGRRSSNNVRTATLRL
jgi:hypothetical protein